MGQDHETQAAQAARLMAALDGTWVAAEHRIAGGWLLRRGEGAGRRVSCATALAGDADPADAVAGLAAWGQAPVFRVTPAEVALDARLAAAGYGRIDPTLVYAGPSAVLALRDPGGLAAIRSALPLARMAEIWDAGGIGPARRAVMARSGAARTWLLGRAEDRAAGAAFVAVADGVGMLHALEVAPWARGRGVGRGLTAAAASWVAEQGAGIFALAVTAANVPARALYDGLGLTPAAAYHYRA